MLNLQKRISGVDENKKYMDTRIAVREKLLAQEIKDLEANIRGQRGLKVTMPTGKLHELDLVITPEEGTYRGGVFKFHIEVPVEYNVAPPAVKCLTKIWHPNIDEDGNICLSLLRQNSLDQFGWMPTRNITEVVHGLMSLFSDLIDFDDPLNNEAAQQYKQDKRAFTDKVANYIRSYCR